MESPFKSSRRKSWICFHHILISERGRGGNCAHGRRSNRRKYGDLRLCSRETSKYRWPTWWWWWPRPLKITDATTLWKPRKEPGLWEEQGSVEGSSWWTAGLQEIAAEKGRPFEIPFAATPEEQILLEESKSEQEQEQE